MAIDYDKLKNWDFGEIEQTYTTKDSTLYALGLGLGETMLLGLLCASASYIAVPAAMRLALPEASPSIYLTMSLAITFPFNLSVGIPLYFFVASAITPG